mmetsp:Transcript_19826/g.35255  ORF Transcript_19826/g.35255 Transcript_19826/m.35255 type:complete len:84 (+) Transcript_19826:143-394(+)
MLRVRLEDQICRYSLLKHGSREPTNDYHFLNQKETTLIIHISFQLRRFLRDWPSPPDDLEGPRLIPVKCSTISSSSIAFALIS